MNKHLKFIDTLPCLICGKNGATHHHLLRVSREYLTPTNETVGLMFPKFKSKGMGTKSDYRFCVPVCPACHARAHQYGNDKAFFENRGIANIEKAALFFYNNSGDYQKCLDYIRWLRLGYVSSC